MKKILPIILILLGLCLVGFFILNQKWFTNKQSQPLTTTEKEELKQKIWETFDSASIEKEVGTFLGSKDLSGDLGKTLLLGYQENIFTEIDSFNKDRIYSYLTIKLLELVNGEEKISIAVARDSKEQQDILFFANKTPITTKIENVGNNSYQYKVLLKFIPDTKNEWLYFTDIDTKETEFFIKTTKEENQLIVQTTENGQIDLIVHSNISVPFMDFTFYNQNNKEIFHVRDLEQTVFPVRVDYLLSDSLSYKAKKIVVSIDFKYGSGEFIYDLTTGEVTKVRD